VNTLAHTIIYAAGALSVAALVLTIRETLPALRTLLRS